MLCCLESFILSTRSDTATSWSFLNLGGVSVATLYVNDGNQADVIYTSTGVAFITFAGPVLCRVYQGATCQFAFMLHGGVFVVAFWKQKEDIQAGSEEPLLHNANECELDEDQVTQSLRWVVCFDQYREPVLEYEDD